MDDRLSDIFGPAEENSDDSVEEEEEPEEEQEENDISSIFEEQGEVEDDNDYDPWRPLRQKVGHNLKDLYWNEVQQFLDRGKSQTHAEHAALNALLPVWRGRLKKDLHRTSKMDSPYQTRHGTPESHENSSLLY